MGGYNYISCSYQELYADIYLSGLRPSITSQIRGSLLSSDSVPSLTTIFYVALWVMTGTPSDAGPGAKPA